MLWLEDAQRNSDLHDEMARLLSEVYDFRDKTIQRANDGGLAIAFYHASHSNYCARYRAEFVKHVT